MPPKTTNIHTIPPYAREIDNDGGLTAGADDADEEPAKRYGWQPPKKPSEGGELPGARLEVTKSVADSVNFSIQLETRAYTEAEALRLLRELYALALDAQDHMRELRDERHK